MRNWKLLLTIAAVCCVTSGAFALTTFDFEAANSLDNWVVGGTLTPNYGLVTNQAHGGAQSLFVGADTIMTYDLGTTEPGVLSMWVYDSTSIIGAEGDYGPTWGLASESTYNYGDDVTPNLTRSIIGAGLVWKPYLNATGGYAYSASNNSFAGNWLSPSWHGGPRAQGAWTQWNITVKSDNTYTVHRSGGASHSGALDHAFAADMGARSITVTGGRTSANMFSFPTDVWVDDITWTPESELPQPDTRLDDFTFTGPGTAIAVDDLGAGGSTSSMYLGDGDKAFLRWSDSPEFGTLEMKVFDRAASARRANSSYGPRWGVMNNDIVNPVVPIASSPQDCFVGAGLAWKSYIDSNGGYALGQGISGGSGVAQGSWFSPYWFGGPRRVLVQPTRANDNDPVADPNNYLGTPIDGEGDWATWRIEVHEGTQYIITLNPGEADEQIVTVAGIAAASIFYNDATSHTGMNEIFLAGGGGAVAGVWVDDITWIPDSGVGGFTYDFELGGGPNTCKDVNAAVGDFNCDNEVNLLDLTTLGENYNTIGLDPDTSYLLGDTNADGEINLLDLTTLGENYNTTVVPEPATLGLLAIGGLLAIRRR